jgi:hypothetical protein
VRWAAGLPGRLSRPEWIFGKGNHISLLLDIFTAYSRVQLDGWNLGMKTPNCVIGHWNSQAQKHPHRHTLCHNSSQTNWISQESHCFKQKEINATVKELSEVLNF